MAKTLISNPIWGLFSWILPLIVVSQCSKLSSYVISRKSNEMNLKNDKKPNFEAQLDIAPSYHPLQVKGKLMNQT